MTSLAHTGYLVRYLKQVGYIKQRKIRNGKVHRHKKSLYISNKSHSVTISGVLDYILINTQYKQSPQKKKRTKEKDKMRGRQERGKRKKKKECDRKKRKKRGGRDRGERRKREANEKAGEEKMGGKRKKRGK